MDTSEIKQDTIIRDKNLDADAADGSATKSPGQLQRKISTKEIPVAHNAYLELIEPDDESKGFELGENEFVIGRISDCQLILSLYGVSRRHARIYFKNNEYIIKDNNSTNGIYVNGIKVLKCILRNNDQIEIGEAKLIFVEERTRR
jgi:pSer/pThr/pTyr-binding forkhead associated (FHA) protein